jgi:signal transduction histidine kinase
MAHPGDAVAVAGDLAVGLAFVACGAATWARLRRDDLTGPLLVATGVAWLAGSLWDDLALLHRGPLVHLLVAAPVGRPRGWAAWLVVGAAYIEAIVPAAGREELATVALAIAVPGVVVASWARARGVRRRARAVPAVASVAVGAVLVAGALSSGAEAEVVLWFYEAVLVCTAVAFAADARWGAAAEAAVTTLVIDLGDARAGSLTAALAHAVGDPSLVVGYAAGDGRYADEDGRAVELPGPGADRAVTTVSEADAGAVLVHEPAALRAPGLADAVTAAVRLALENERLGADIRARVHDVEASRARLLRARDSERRSLETRLRAGVGRRLEAAAEAIQGLGADPDELLSALPGELDRVRAELHRFAAGLHPPVRAGGLAAALPELAAGAPIPVDVEVRCDRLDEPLETVAWFVCSEALANVAKHSGATRAAIHLAERSGRLVVMVDDDGRGGADPSAGRGLRGLAARVEAAGGRLEVGAGPGGGTRVRAELPARRAHEAAARMARDREPSRAGGARG